MLNKYLSLIFLYIRAAYKKVLLAIGVIPLGFLMFFIIRIGNPAETVPYLLIERAFCGIWPVLLLLGAILLGGMVSVNSLNDRKAIIATHTTTGYTIRRLGLSPSKSYLTMFVYHLVMVLLFLSTAIVSIYVIGKMGLTMADASAVDTKLALGFLRTEIGHGLIPLADPQVILFNVIAVLTLAGECARGCYFSWHNRNTIVGALISLAAMFYIWVYDSNAGFQFLIILVLAVYTILRCGDVLYREKFRKGDLFKANKYTGITDLDSEELDEELYLKVNRYTADDNEFSSMLSRYARDESTDKLNGFKKWNPIWLRRRFMPLGSSLEKANTLFSVALLIGASEHILFYGRWKMQYDMIKDNMKGVTLDSELMMPYFWDLQEYTYVGYIIAIFAVVLLQVYWNYAYYNKETKSVYVMKRLPDRKEYARTIWIAPVIQGIAIAAIMILHTVIDLCCYVVATPEQALHSDYLAHIFSF